MEEFISERTPGKERKAKRSRELILKEYVTYPVVVSRSIKVWRNRRNKLWTSIGKTFFKSLQITEIQQVRNNILVYTQTSLIFCQYPNVLILDTCIVVNQIISIF